VQLIHKHFGVSRKLLIIHYGIKPFLRQIRQLWQPRPRQTKLAKPFVPETPLVNRTLPNAFILMNVSRN
jgi:asparagine synthase (glutamine-hydrolysing)